MPATMTAWGPASVSTVIGSPTANVPVSAVLASMTTSWSPSGGVALDETERVEGLVGQPLAADHGRPHVGVAHRFAVLVDDLGERLDVALGSRHAVDVADRIDEGDVDSGSLLAHQLVVEGELAADVDVRAGVGPGDGAAQRLVEGVGEHQGARHEGNAEQDGDAGGQEPQLARGQVLEGGLEHRDQSPNFLRRSSTRSAVGADISSTMRTVGEEEDALGVGGGDGVMGDHDDRLTELVHRGAHERQDLGARAGVEVAGGLVAEDDLGAAGQGAGHGDTLLLATRELAGRCPRRFERPTVATTWSSQAWSALRPARDIGRVMFSRAVNVGMRLNAWKMKPILSDAAS